MIFATTNWLTNSFRPIVTTACVVAAIAVCAPESCRAAERNVGHLCFHNDTTVGATIYLYHRQSPKRVWKGYNWRIASGRSTHFTVKSRPINVRGDWRIKIAFTNGARTAKQRISSIGVHRSDGKWYVFASNVYKGQSPKARLPITARRGSSTWTIDARGVVTSRIKYTVGSGTGSKRYASGLIVEFSDGSIYTASATKTIGRPPFRTKKGTYTNRSHRALPLNRLSRISRVYIKHSTNSSGPNTIREWINEARKWAKDGEEIYKELKGNDLVRDAVKFSAGP